ncbi:ABC transporter substrate-binding protein, partial [Chloroflexota bacterium]
MKKLISIGLMMLILTLLLAMTPACGREEGESKTIKFGLLTPLSGIAAQWGREIEEGAQWRVDTINEAGGIRVGSDRYLIKLVKGDSKFTGSEAVNEATRLIQHEGVHFMLGPITTWSAIDPIVLEGKCFVMCMTNSELVQLGNPYMFMGAAPVRVWYPTFWDQAYQFHPEIQTVAVISPDTNTYDSHFESDLSAHEKHGREVVYTKRYTISQTDYYPLLTPLVAKKPDAISLAGVNKGDADLMVKQVRELGYTGIIASANHGDPQSTIDIAGCEYAEGFLNNDPDYSSNLYPKSVRELYNDFRQRFPGRPLALTTYLAHGAIDLFAAAIEEASSIDPDEVMKVFDNPH